MIKKSVRVSKITPMRCDICHSTDVLYLVGYWDPDNLGPRIKDHPTYPTRQKRACKDHLLEVTAILYKELNLTPVDVTFG